MEKNVFKMEVVLDTIIELFTHRIHEFFLLNDDLKSLEECKNLIADIINKDGEGIDLSLATKRDKCLYLLGLSSAAGMLQSIRKVEASLDRFVEENPINISDKKIH